MFDLTKKSISKSTMIIFEVIKVVLKSKGEKSYKRSILGQNDRDRTEKLKGKKFHFDHIVAFFQVFVASCRPKRATKTNILQKGTRRSIQS